ncbi:hypothetical protein [Arthrobacter sp. JSM 101049]|uniref:hypothetical protein n=1 Tax=Arthrobacter sp. JSM 101049 TaxID=929097 RepID=UPI00356965C4
MAYLYASLATQFARSVLDHEGGVFGAIMLALLIVIVLVFLPLVARQVLHARRYAHDHAALLLG